ncbi:MAG: ZIP family metal transporter [Gemmatimonadota bacterium]
MGPTVPKGTVPKGVEGGCPVQELYTTISEWGAIGQGLAGGVVITLLNAVGALAVLAWRNPSPKFLDGALGFAAGVMLTASFTSLILPGIEYGGVLPVLVGIAAGALALDIGDHVIPHFHEIRGHEGVETDRVRAVWLFIIAITLHNAPEGLAVGVAFGSGDFSHGVQLMLAIGIQNVPEGLAVAVSAVNIGLGAHFYASFVGIRAGLVEIPMAVLGAWAVTAVEPLLPYAMGFAAGAMLYVISDEIVPETHREGHERLATAGTLLGVIVMLYLDVVLA